jgi:hypothetical protein
MECSTGWLLDVSIEESRATIWIKTSEGIILKLIDTYQPNFYVLPKDEDTGADLFQILSQQSRIKKVEWEDKFTDLFDYDRYGMKRLICVFPESLPCYKTLLKSLEKDPRVALEVLQMNVPIFIVLLNMHDRRQICFLKGSANVKVIGLQLLFIEHL